MLSTPAAAPIAASADINGRRIVTLDLIRGIAVMGILSVNIVDFAGIQQLYINPAALGWPSLGATIVWAVNMLLVDGKMRTLFSMLFGASTLLVIERAEARSAGSAMAVHFRRMAVLLVIGLLHYTLLWEGDILTSYALTGFILYRFRNMEMRRMAIRAAVMVTIGMLIFGLISIGMVHMDHVAHAAGATARDIRNWNGNAGEFYPTPDRVAKQMALHLGPWSALAAHSLSKVPGVMIQNIVFLPSTLGLMLIGMMAYRSGLLTGDWDDARMKRLALWTIPIGLAAHAAYLVAVWESHFYSPLIMGLFMSVLEPFRIAQALGTAALIILMGRRMGPIAQRVAAAGRTAFSNYLGTSIVATAIFYGWGGGLFGSMDRWQEWLFVPVFWAAMLLWSKPWLERFHYGPLEWVWRSLARGKFQPMRKGDVLAAATTASA